MSGENELARFLDQYPWTSEPVLEAVFGQNFKRLIQSKETRGVDVPGFGRCWGVRREKLSSLPGVCRREVAKFYLMRQYGKDALWIGGAPGIDGSDLCALVGKHNKFWLRIWVDNGMAAVEALPVLGKGDGQDQFNMADLVLTTSLERAEHIKRLLTARNILGKGALLIYARDDDQVLKLNQQASSSIRPVKEPVGSTAEVRAALSIQRQGQLENRRHDQNIGKLFLTLKEADFDLLSYVGNNPHFTIQEISYLLAFSTTGSLGKELEPGKKKTLVGTRLERLKGLELIEDAAAPLAGIILSPMGLEVLAKYWGITQERMRRFHAWPQVKNTQGDITYSENALSHIKDHTKVVQRFIFGLFDSSWRMQKPYGGLDLYLDTIIGKRIYFEDLATGKLDWVIPDAVVDLSFWRRTWRDGHVHEPKIVFSKRRLLIEVDRATNPIARLQDRIQKYGRIWRQLSGNPAQVWIIDGSPWREKEILEMLRSAGVPGWTVLVERLALDRWDAWWDVNFRMDAPVKYRAHGGMAPLRKIWRNTEDYDLHHLLDHSPWEQKMTLSKPVVSVPRGY